MQPKLVTLPTDWPGEPLPVMPGDFSKYVSQGLGLDVPLIVRQWDDPLKALSGPNYYGLDPLQTDPVRGAPSNLPEGGVIYFHDTASDDDLRNAFSLMGLQQARKDFAAFKGDAEDTRRDRYLTQLRIVSKPALHQFFGAGKHIAALADQTLTMEQAVLTFLHDERSRWNDPRWRFSGKLSGTLGGDGDWAKEALAFGFMVENSNWGVYRVWSRPWLVTK